MDGNTPATQSCTRQRGETEFLGLGTKIIGVVAHTHAFAVSDDKRWHIAADNRRQPNFLSAAVAQKCDLFQSQFNFLCKSKMSKLGRELKGSR
jgi:hypothetical protein